MMYVSVVKQYYENKFIVIIFVKMFAMYRAYA